jgi:hypothetical protein
VIENDSADENRSTEKEVFLFLFNIQSCTSSLTIKHAPYSSMVIEMVVKQIMKGLLKQKLNLSPPLYIIH